MKIQLMSDLHLDCWPIDLMDNGEFDVIVMAGDIDEGTRGIEWAAQLPGTTPILYVLGNHEWFGHAMPRDINKFKRAAEGSRVKVLENDSVIINNVSFHGCTLWSDFNLFNDADAAMMACEAALTDYRRIRFNRGGNDTLFRQLRARDCAIRHAQSVAWLEAALENSTTQHNVIITHHAPSIFGVKPSQRDDILSASYASDLSRIGLKHPDKISWWLHGHSHYLNITLEDMLTHSISNPRGYPEEPVRGFHIRNAVEF